MHTQKRLANITALKATWNKWVQICASFCAGQIKGNKLWNTLKEILTQHKNSQVKPKMIHTEMGTFHNCDA